MVRDGYLLKVFKSICTGLILNSMCCEEITRVYSMVRKNKLAIGSNLIRFWCLFKVT
jgi:hypothetical protein